MANIPSVIENQEHRLSDVLATVLERCGSGPVDIATAYFAISGYRLLRERLHDVGALRLLIGSEPTTGADIGLRPERKEEYLRLLRGDLEAEPFAEETLRLVEDLIALLRTEKVQVRQFDKGFLHAKACEVAPNCRTLQVLILARLRLRPTSHVQCSLAK